MPSYPRLFVNGEGKPLSFLVTGCVNPRKLTNLIKSSPLPDTNAFLASFITDSVWLGQLMPLKNYWANKASDFDDFFDPHDVMTGEFSWDTCRRLPRPHPHPEERQESPELPPPPPPSSATLQKSPLKDCFVRLVKIDIEAARHPAMTDQADKEAQQASPSNSTPDSPTQHQATPEQCEVKRWPLRTRRGIPRNSRLDTSVESAAVNQEAKQRRRNTKHVRKRRRKSLEVEVEEEEEDEPLQRKIKPVFPGHVSKRQPRGRRGGRASQGIANFNERMQEGVCRGIMSSDDEDKAECESDAAHSSGEESHRSVCLFSMGNTTPEREHNTNSRMSDRQESTPSSHSGQPTHCQPDQATQQEAADRDTPERQPQTHTPERQPQTHTPRGRRRQSDIPSTSPQYSEGTTTLKQADKDTTFQRHKEMNVSGHLEDTRRREGKDTTPKPQKASTLTGKPSQSSHLSRQDGYCQASAQKCPLFISPPLSGHSVRSEKKEPYSVHEDVDIVVYIDAFQEYHRLGGREMWQEMEHYFKHRRTWQSLKERFRKRIAPNLCVYIKLGLNRAVVDRMKHNVAIEYETGRRQKKPRKSFTTAEDRRILHFISSNHRFQEVGGVVMWKEMASSCGELDNHTWHSLKQRFHKQILPNIRKYKLSKNTVLQLQIRRRIPKLDGVSASESDSSPEYFRKRKGLATPQQEAASKRRTKRRDTSTDLDSDSSYLEVQRRPKHTYKSGRELKGRLTQGNRSASNTYRSKSKSRKVREEKSDTDSPVYRSRSKSRKLRDKEKRDTDSSSVYRSQNKSRKVRDEEKSDTDSLPHSYRSRGKSERVRDEDEIETDVFVPNAHLLERPGRVRGEGESEGGDDSAHKSRRKERRGRVRGESEESESGSISHSHKLRKERRGRGESEEESESGESDSDSISHSHKSRKERRGRGESEEESDCGSISHSHKSRKERRGRVRGESEESDDDAIPSTYKSRKERKRQRGDSNENNSFIPPTHRSKKRREERISDESEDVDDLNPRSYKSKQKRRRQRTSDKTEEESDESEENIDDLNPRSYKSQQKERRQRTSDKTEEESNDDEDYVDDSTSHAGAKQSKQGRGREESEEGSEDSDHPYSLVYPHLKRRGGKRRLLEVEHTRKQQQRTERAENASKPYQLSIKGFLKGGKPGTSHTSSLTRRDRDREEEEEEEEEEGEEEEEELEDEVHFLTHQKYNKHENTTNTTNTTTTKHCSFLKSSKKPLYSQDFTADISPKTPFRNNTLHSRRHLTRKEQEGTSTTNTEAGGTVDTMDDDGDSVQSLTLDISPEVKKRVQERRRNEDKEREKVNVCEKDIKVLEEEDLLPCLSLNFSAVRNTCSHRKMTQEGGNKEDIPGEVMEEEEEDVSVVEEEEEKEDDMPDRVIEHEEEEEEVDIAGEVIEKDEEKEEEEIPQEEVVEQEEEEEEEVVLQLVVEEDEEEDDNLPEKVTQEHEKEEDRQNKTQEEEGKKEDEQTKTQEEEGKKEDDKENKTQEEGEKEDEQTKTQEEEGKKEEDEQNKTQEEEKRKEEAKLNKTQEGKKKEEDKQNTQEEGKKKEDDKENKTEEEEGKRKEDDKQNKVTEEHEKEEENEEEEEDDDIPNKMQKHEKEKEHNTSVEVIEEEKEEEEEEEDLPHKAQEQEEEEEETDDDLYEVTETQIMEEFKEMKEDDPPSLSREAEGGGKEQQEMRKEEEEVEEEEERQDKRSGLISGELVCEVGVVTDTTYCSPHHHSPDTTPHRYSPDSTSSLTVLCTPSLSTDVASQDTTPLGLAPDPTMHTPETHRALTPVPVPLKKTSALSEIVKPAPTSSSTDLEAADHTLSSDSEDTVVYVESDTGRSGRSGHTSVPTTARTLRSAAQGAGPSHTNRHTPRGKLRRQKIQRNK